jgi:putative sterol carrier protein
MVAIDTVEQVLEEYRRKLLDERVAQNFRGWNKTMQYFFTDLDQFYHIRFQDGIPQAVAKGKPEKAEIQYEMSAETFVAMGRKEISGLKAYTQGKVKLKAAMPDLFKLQKVDSL